MFKKGDLVKVQYPVEFENGEQLAKCTGVVTDIMDIPEEHIGEPDKQIVEICWCYEPGPSFGPTPRQYYSEALELIAKANQNV